MNLVIGAPDHRLEMMKEFGADYTVSIETTTPEERVKMIKEMTSGRGADVTIGNLWIYLVQ